MARRYRHYRCRPRHPAVSTSKRHAALSYRVLRPQRKGVAARDPDRRGNRCALPDAIGDLFLRAVDRRHGPVRCVRTCSDDDFNGRLLDIRSIDRTLRQRGGRNRHHRVHDRGQPAVRLVPRRRARSTAGVVAGQPGSGFCLGPDRRDGNHHPVAVDRFGVGLRRSIPNLDLQCGIDHHRNRVRDRRLRPMGWICDGGVLLLHVSRRLCRIDLLRYQDVPPAGLVRDGKRTNAAPATAAWRVCRALQPPADPRHGEQRGDVVLFPVSGDLRNPDPRADRARA